MKLPRITWKRVLGLFGLILIAAIAGFVIWASTTNPIMPEAEAALISDERVTVSTEGFIAFEPQAARRSIGFVMYPGGRVQAEAYAPLTRALAEEGFFSAIVYAPLNLSLFNSSAARRVIDAHPDIAYWVVGGHSLGGVAASRFANGNPDTVDGLAFVASVPFPGLNLNERDDLAVISIYGSLDALLTVEDVADSVDDLPAETIFVEVVGGNHANFGWYGEQSGDAPAEISREDQQNQTVAALVDFMLTISGEHVEAD